MIKIKVEDIVATNNIPSKISYSNSDSRTKKEIYYFGNPPKKPETLAKYLNKKSKGDKI